MDQKDAPGLPDGLRRPPGNPSGDPLIPLAVVVRTHVEAGVVLAVIPADDLPFPWGSGFPSVPLFPYAPSSLQHRHEPAPRGDGVGLEEGVRRLAAHLRRDDAGQVLLHGQLVDGGKNTRPRREKGQIPGKGLRLPALPVKPDSDRHLVEGEGPRPLRGEPDLRPPEELPAEGIGENDDAPQRAADELAGEGRPAAAVNAVQAPADLGISVADTDFDLRLVHHNVPDFSKWW